MRSEVQIFPGPPALTGLGAVAQLGERGLCKPEVVGSNPISSTRFVKAIRFLRNSVARSVRWSLFGVSSSRQAASRVFTRCSLTVEYLSGSKRSMRFAYARDSEGASSWSAVGTRRQRFGQASKGRRWMPWRQEAMKDVDSCEKLREAANQALIRRCPNGETRPGSSPVIRD